MSAIQLNGSTVQIGGSIRPECWETMRALVAVRTHERYRSQCIGLAPTENLMSPLARLMQSSDFSHRYLFQNPLWKYVGGKYLSEVEQLAIELSMKLYNAAYANVRPLSGENCIGIITNAFIHNGTRMYHFGSNDGGHFAASALCERFGGEVRNLPYNPQDACIDVDRCTAEFSAAPPDMIYLDASLILFPHPVRELRNIAQNALIDYDGSQVMGLIAGGEFQDPLREGAQVLNGSMHKSFPGPQKAVILANSEEYRERIERAIFPAMVSNFHMHHVAALAVTLAEETIFGEDYARQTVRNSQELAQSMHENGLDVQCEHLGFTRSHQVWVDTQQQCNADQAMQDLYRSNIIATVNMIPSTRERGLRIGTPEVTRLGMRESEMTHIGSLVADSLLHRRTNDVILADVLALREQFREPQYCFNIDEGSS